jgi:DtxR family manganese transport transcriptional regulator
MATIGTLLPNCQQHVRIVACWLFSVRDRLNVSLESGRSWRFGKREMARSSKERRAETPAQLPAERTQALRFGKTRSARSSALLEDYVELIADLLETTGEARPTDIARRIGVSHATVIRTISRLKRNGVATARPYRGVFLTEAGRLLADRVRARHRLVVDLLLALGVPTEAAEGDAEGIEHYVSAPTLKAFAQFLQSGRDNFRPPDIADFRD